MTRSRSHMGVSIAVALTAFVAADPALAATEIAGDAKSLSIRLENSSIDEALKSLGGTFDFSYRAPTSLTKSLSGTYRGPLKEVIKNLLSGYDFVLTTRGTAIEVSVLGKSGKSADVVIERKSPAAKPAVAAQLPAAPKASPPNVAPDMSRADVPVAAASNADIPQPMLLAQNDPSKMPMPTPSQSGPMPMPTPQVGGDSPMPRPDPSGTGPMPMPQPNADGPMPMLIPPTANAQAPYPQGQTVPAQDQATPAVAPPKPN